MAAKKKWGGYRPGSGRRPKNGVSGVSHHTRPELSGRHPIQITLNTKLELGTLRKKRVVAVLRDGLVEGCDSGVFRICHFSIQRHNLRFLVEAHDRQALSRGMQGINVRLAKALNRLWSRNGSVFADRYDMRVLKNGRDVRASLCYVLNGVLNDPQEARKLKRRPDMEYSSARYFDGWKDDVEVEEPPAGRAPVARPLTSLLQSGWKKFGLIGVDELPSP